jgi:BlaI family transcriptional regulator, penicillinase repressor
VPTIDLTDLQYAIMRVLWDHGECTVTAVQEGLLPERRLAATTVATLLTRLEKRGVIAHHTEGRQYVYRATISEREVRRSMVSRITDLLFDGSPAALMSHLLTSKAIRRGDLDRMRELIDEAESKRVEGTARDEKRRRNG